MTNDQMKAGRFVTWAKARKRLSAIQEAFSAGKSVYVCTQTKATRYTAKHAEMFRATKSGLFVQRGKGWDCLDFTALRME
jgi:hypothetical protein